MFKKIVLSFIFLQCLIGVGQTITIYGTVMDEQGQPIPKARFYFQSNPAQKYATDAEGSYSVTYNKGEYDSLIFYHVGFEKDKFLPTRRMEKRAKNDSIRYNPTLPNRTFDILTVFANQPEVVFGTQNYSVADFEFYTAGQIILLTYEKTLEKNSVLRLLDSSRNVVDSYYVQGEAVELTTDFKNNVHLLTKERVYLIKVKDDRITTYLEDRDYYFKNVAPVIDTIGDNIYFSNYSDLYPAFDYFEFNRADSSYFKLLNLEDSEMMEMYRSEFKYVDVRTKIWAHDKQLQTGVDKEIWVGASVFTNSLYYEPLYAPLFKKGEDSILVFDHYKNYLFKYTPAGGFTDSVRISYHQDARKSGWEQPLIQDEINGKIYGLFLRNGYTYLSEIDANNGQIERSFKLHYKYVDKIIVKEDYVYYIYRPFESTQKKYIYKEQLTYGT